MFFLTSYETEAQYNSVKDSLSKPHVALTLDNNKVHYIHAPKLILEVFSNSALTEKPTVGGAYSSLWVRINVDIGINENFDWGSLSEDWKCAYISGRDTEYNDPPTINLYVDFYGDYDGNGFSAGDVVEVPMHGEPTAFLTQPITEFYS